MPSHDYQCDSCLHAWEEINTLAEHDAVERGPCPKCGEKTVRTLFLHAPAIKTSATWLRGQKNLLDHFGDTPEGRSQLNYRVSVARAHGYNPNMHDVYDETVALFPGDPEGYIPHDDPAGHMKRVCERRGVGCDSSLAKVKAPAPRPIEAAPLANDIVRDLAAEKISANPDLGRKPKAEMAEMIRQDHSYSI